MKIYPYLLKISLAFTLLVITVRVGRAQSGNMSDITQPDPVIIPANNSGGSDSSSTDKGSVTNSGGSDSSSTDKGSTTNSGGSDSSSTDRGSTTNSGGSDSGSTDTDTESENRSKTSSDPEALSNNSNPDSLLDVNPDTTINPNPNSTGSQTDANSQTNPTDSQTSADQATQDSQQNQAADNTNLAEDSQNGADSSGASETTNDDNLAEDSQTSADSSDESKTDANAEEKSETDAQSEEEDVAKKEDETEKKAESAPQQEINRTAYEAQIQEASPSLAVQLHEEFQVTQLVSSSGVQLYGDIPSVGQISDRLGQLWQQTGKKAAFINVSVQSNQLETFVVLPTPTDIADSNNYVANSSKDNSKVELKVKNVTSTEAIRETVKYSSRKEILTIAKQFREEVSNSRNIGKNSYLESAQKLYQLIIKPLEAELEDEDVDILVFSMDSGLRLIPLAALHDGEQFLVEKYALALVPSFGLTDTRYVTINQSPILAMGASEFEDRVSLPTMPLELRNITRNPRQGEVFLNEEFTVNNFIAQNRRRNPFRIIHLGTHAQFKAGDFADSFIQFSDRKLKLPELRRISDELGWSTNNTAPIELLVLSACETALGDEESELGFAGLAVQAGVKSALASLWYISDLGTLALMSEFYDNLSNNLVKAEALRATQLSMLKGEVKVKDRQLLLSNGESFTLPSTFPQGSLTLADPYFWSAFTLIGNWN